MVICCQCPCKGTCSVWDCISCSFDHVWYIYCKTLFCWILILRFSYVENWLHFNLAEFLVDFIKQFVSLWWWAVSKICVYFILRSYSNSLRNTHVLQYNNVLVSFSFNTVWCTQVRWLCLIYFNWHCQLMKQFNHARAAANLNLI